MIENAIKEAKRSSEHYKIGCVITDKKGRILSHGFNQRKSHPFQAHYANKHNPEKIFLHAEIAALIKVRDGEPHTIYVGRIMKNGSWGIARPCPICAAAIKDAGIKNVVFTDEKGEIVTYNLEE